MSLYSALGDLTSSSEDPWPKAKAEVRRAIQRYMTDFDTWNDMLETTNTAENEKFMPLMRSLKKQYKGLSGALTQLSKSLAQVRANPSEYPEISPNELAERDGWISSMKTTIDDYRKKMTSEHVKNRVASDKQKKKDKETETPLEKAGRQYNDELLGGHQRQQHVERDVQDNIMDDMLHTLKRLNVHGNLISVELEEQSRIMDDIDEEMDQADSTLRTLTGRLDQLLGHSENKKIALIVLLVIVLVVMVYFMF
jgi:chromosome segregation ATPase